MSDQTTLPDAAPAEGHQMFRLVDAEKLGTSGGGCGCGGHGHGGAAAAAEATGAAPAAGGGCGCGGHGHAARAQEAPAARPASGGCGCGGHGHAHAAAPTAGGAGAQASTSEEELVIHSLPRVVRKLLLFTALDQLPVGESIVLVAPHQPEPVFEHLRTSQSHYRVESLEAGPVDWRYRVTRLS